MSKTIELKDAFKGYTLDQDKIVSPKETVTRFRDKLKTLDLLSDMGMGLNLLKKRKLDLKPSKVKDKKAVAKIFKKIRQKKQA